MLAKFDPAKVQIERKRFSTTQGEVLVSYNGTRLDQYGDTITLQDGEWRGLPDEVWIEAALRAFAAYAL